jgi:hypothetical protein
MLSNSPQKSFRLAEKPFNFSDYTYWVMFMPMPFFIPASLILNPEPGILVTSVMVGYWIGCFIASLRRRGHPTRTDALFVKLAFLPLLIIGPICSLPVLSLRVMLIGH